MAKLFWIAALLSIFCGTAHAEKILVLGSQTTNPYNGDNGAYIFNRLVAEGHTVTHSPTVPASIAYLASDPINGYDQVWVFGSTTMESAPSMSGLLPASYTGAPWATPLINFIKDGGGVMIFSEVNCCNTTAALAQVVMDATLRPSNSAQHGPRANDPSDFNVIQSGADPAYNGVLTPGSNYSCISMTLQSNAAVRKTDVSNSSQTLLTAGPGGPTSVAIFQANDMTVGKGALAVFGDADPFRSSSGATAQRKEYLVRLFAQALTGAQTPNAGFCATVTGNLDVTGLQFDKTTVKPGDAVKLDVEITNNTSTPVSNESVTLIVDPELNLSSATATLVCPSGNSTLNIHVAAGDGNQSITLSPIGVASAEACTATLDFGVGNQFVTTPDAAKHIPSGLQGGLSVLAAPAGVPAPVPANHTWGLIVMAFLLMLAAVKIRFARH